MPSRSAGIAPRMKAGLNLIVIPKFLEERRANTGLMYYLDIDEEDSVLTSIFTEMAGGQELWALHYRPE